MKILLERRDRNFFDFPWKATSAEYPSEFGFAGTKRGAVRDLLRNIKRRRQKYSVIESEEVEIP